MLTYIFLYVCVWKGGKAVLDYMSHGADSLPLALYSGNTSCWAQWIICNSRNPTKVGYMQSKPHYPLTITSALTTPYKWVPWTCSFIPGLHLYPYMQTWLCLLKNFQDHTWFLFQSHSSFEGLSHTFQTNLTSLEYDSRKCACLACFWAKLDLWQTFVPLGVKLSLPLLYQKNRGFHIQLRQKYNFLDPT